MKIEIIDSPAGHWRLKPALQQLFLSCFDKSLSDERWEYLYLSAPDGCAISIAAWDPEGLCGHYAIVPMEAVDDAGRPVRFARGMSLAIAARSRSAGLLPKLMQAMREAAIGRDVPWTLGFPNEVSWRPLVMFCGWRVLFESPVVELDVVDGCKAVDATEVVRTTMDRAGKETECCLQPTTLPPGSVRPAYDDPEFMSWRGRFGRFETFVVNQQVVVVAKVFEGDALDVMDAWTVGETTDEYALARLARFLSLSRVLVTQRHAENIGMSLQGGRTTGYTVRQAVACNGTCPPPEFRFSLLFSDVY